MADHWCDWFCWALAPVVVRLIRTIRIGRGSPSGDGYGWADNTGMDPAGCGIGSGCGYGISIICGGGGGTLVVHRQGS